MRLRGPITVALAAAFLAAACGRPADPPSQSVLPSAPPSADDSALRSAATTASASFSPTPEPEPAVLLAAGDVADCAYEGAALTAEILADHPESTIAVLGDLAYPDATAERFDACYDPTWGAFVDRTRPALGNHDLNADAGAPYYATFGDAAGTPGEGWYSYQLGEWHVVVLNSNCDRVGCGEGSPQHDWLVADLAQAEAEAVCTLAYWHHPRFTSGPHGDDPRVGPFWSALADAGAELILVSHDHHYERFAPLAPDGTPAADGPRQFIVGTGGAIIRPTVRPAPGSELIVDDAWGVLRLELSPDGYTWSFLSVDRGELDAGSGDCH